MKKPSKTIKKVHFRQSLFWDVDAKTIDPKHHARYVIERILELGNDKEVSWMIHYYPSRTVKSVVNKSRGVLHEKTKALWSLMYP